MEASRLYKKVIPYTPKRLQELGSTFKVELQTLSHKQLQDLDIYTETQDYNQLLIRVAELSIINLEALYQYWTKTIHDLKEVDVQPYEYLGYIDYDILLDIGFFALEMSKAPENFYSRLDLGLDLSLDEKFLTSSWRCEECQSKGIDKVRNCGFRGEQEKDKKFFVYVGENKYTYCPIYELDEGLVSSAFECYTFYDKGILPESGGMYDQTQFFVLSAQYVEMKSNLKQKKEIDKMRKGHNNGI